MCDDKKPEPLLGVTLDFFCYVTKRLDRMYPNRACGNGINVIATHLRQAEEAYRDLPEMPKQEPGAKR